MLSGVAGLLAGAFSMALGEYTSVTTANEQIDSEVRVERRAFRKHPQAERAELVAMLIDMGMTRETATQATEEIHRDETRAVNFHLVQELGVDPSEKPSPWIAADLVVRDVRDRRHRAAHPVPTRIRVAVGRDCSAAASVWRSPAVSPRASPAALWWASLRQLVFGGVAIAATYLVGTLVDSIL